MNAPRVPTPGRCHCKGAGTGPGCLLQANGRRGLALGTAKSRRIFCCAPMLFIAQWLQIRGMGWTGSCQKKPKRNRRLIQFIFTDVRFYGGESPQYMTICWGNLQSLSSLIAKIPWPRASGVQWGDHNRAFPCWSNPINCFPSSCSESVESDGEEGGEECVLSRCPTSNLSPLRGGGSLGLSPCETEEGGAGN